MTPQPFSLVWKVCFSLTLLIAIFIAGSQVPAIAADMAAQTTGTPIATSSPAQTSSQTLFLPLLADNLKTGPEITAVKTLDNRGTTRTAFIPGDQIHFQAYGIGPTPGDIEGEAVWVEEGPCGMRLIYSGPVVARDYDWKITTNATARNCPGIYTQTLQLTFQGKSIEASSDFAINQQTGQVQVRKEQAFDKCEAPSLYALQTWWDKSYYYGVNLYIGGVSRFCDNVNLNGVYIHEAKEMGWWFIPTWVGPQAPCTKYINRINWDPEIAYEEGRREATMALEAAADLGLRGEQIIYYDLENYGYDATTRCRQTVAEFIRGWSERLHESGSRSGVYGGRTSYLTDYPVYKVPVDNIWIAAWMTPYQYRSSVNVYGISWLPDSVYSGSRIRQYAGGHVETWGGISMSIDSNASDGEVVVLAPESSASAGDSGIFDANAIQAMQLVSSEEGWVLGASRLLWTEDGGSSWEERTPRIPSGYYPAGAHFLEDGSGWFVAADDLGGVELLYTPDKGLSWQPVALPDLDLLAPVRSASLEFSDSANGWLSLELESSSNFRLGELLATEDGGKTWELRTIPVGAPVQFSNGQAGVVTDDQTGEQYVTLDGGRTWNRQTDAHRSTEQSLVLPENSQPAESLTLPRNAVAGTLGPDGAAWTLVQEGSCVGEKAARDRNSHPDGAPFTCQVSRQLLSTSDGGKTWTEVNLP